MPAYKRILLKLSGEALMGDDAFGINRATIVRMVREVQEITGLGVEVAVVIGGGNIFRGVAGGYRLARPARDISLVEIVEAMEGALAMTECSIHDGHCGIEASCGARANWRRINDVVADALRRVTLADMALPAGAPDTRKTIAVSLSAF